MHSESASRDTELVKRMIPWLEPGAPFPDPSEALTEAEGAPGLLAAGGVLSPERLLDAYRSGIFPWFSDNQPILWWSTDPRMVLLTDEFKVSRSLSKTLRKIEHSMVENGPWQVRFDTAFREVIKHCAAPREGSDGTWISSEIIDAYCALHDLGYAHSSELWLDGRLVGGSAWIVPSTLHAPLRQDAVLLKRGADAPAARAFLDFLRSDAARAIIRAHGYED